MSNGDFKRLLFSGVIAVLAGFLLMNIADEYYLEVIFPFMMGNLRIPIEQLKLLF